MAFLDTIREFAQDPNASIRVDVLPGWVDAADIRSMIWEPSWPSPKDVDMAGWRGAKDTVELRGVRFPRRFEVRVESRDPAQQFVGFLFFELPDDARSVIYRGGLAAVGEWDVIQRWAITREHPLEWWKRYALLRIGVIAAAALGREGDGGERPTDAETAAWSEVADASRDVSTTRRRDRITDEVLVDVARVYREAWNSGLNPTQQVASHFHKSVPTAARWVSLSRRAGHLRPSDSTRGGEIPEEDAGV